MNKHLARIAFAALGIALALAPAMSTLRAQLASGDLTPSGYIFLGGEQGEPGGCVDAETGEC